MSTITRFRAAGSPFDLSLSWLLGPDIRIEEKIDGDRYLVRAELPGIDPAKDVQVSLAGGDLRLQVERKEEHIEKGHSEFRYGTFYRTIPLPVGAKADTLSAEYHDGILEISALVGEAGPAAKTIPISVAKKADKT
ncbi:Hsp20/alpha crystallin family protein [Actinoplanes sp. NPDC049599]|uniref:Hsp20/alpha crystallin family protein n=1 Tax=Actinoplanes sp. NPDC049599 TaxID=3363903 RepID=UPI0037B45971